LGSRDGWPSQRGGKVSLAKSASAGLRTYRDWDAAEIDTAERVAGAVTLKIQEFEENMSNNTLVQIRQEAHTQIGDDDTSIVEKISGAKA
jgi:hypothetical protein